MDKNLTNNPEPLWTKDYILLLISNFLVFTGFYTLLTTLPYYVFETGGSSSDVGMVTAILVISAIVIRPFSGILLEKVDKKRFLAIGIIICLIAIKSFSWATTVLSIMLIRFVHGFGWGISTTTYGTIASDLVPASRRGEGMGYFSSAGTIAMSIGPPLGIIFIQNKGFPNLFTGATAITFMALILLYFITIPKIETISKKEKFLSRLIEKTALFPSFLALLLGFTYGGITSFITLFGEEIGLGNVGWFFTINAIFIFIIRSIAGRVFDKKGHFWVMVPGAIFSFLGVLILSYVNSISTLILSAIVYGIGFGTVQPSLLAWAVNTATPDRRGAANATYFSAFDVGIGLGSVILGNIGEIMSYGKMYKLSSLPMLGILIIYLIYWYRDKK